MTVGWDRAVIGHKYTHIRKNTDRKISKIGIFKIDWAIGTVEYGIIPIQVGKKSTEKGT